MPKRVALCILDGWGVAPKPNDGDATRVATFFRQLWENNPHMLLEASGEAVGLPHGQMGNSEVGHMTLGLGRVVKQDLVRIDEAVEQKSWEKNEAFRSFTNRLRREGGTAHVLGLASTGGVHSHLDHMIAVVQALTEERVPVFVHAILDGRDTPPQSGAGFISALQSALRNLPSTRLVSLCGRFFAMDRDQRWDRTETAYRLIAEQKAERHVDAPEELFSDPSYEGDEFARPTLVGAPYEAKPQDGLLMINFRSDRARQIILALGDPTFSAFSHRMFPRFAQLISMTEYDATFAPFCTPLFQKPSTKASLGQILAEHGKRQLRLAETEKYAHVTFFFNGGREAPFEGESRILIPSPKVATYDLSPHMSAREVTDAFKKALVSVENDVIVVNYANADMLGHTGQQLQAEESIRFVDGCLREIVETAKAAGVVLLITADHGNAEQMRSVDGTVHTAHTTNPVPFVGLGLPEGSYLSGEPQQEKGYFAGGSLADVAPTILALLNVPQPVEMTGQSLVPV